MVVTQEIRATESLLAHFQKLSLLRFRIPEKVWSVPPSYCLWIGVSEWHHIIVNLRKQFLRQEEDVEM